MFRFVVWSTAIAAMGYAAMVVPIEPALLEKIALSSGGRDSGGIERSRLPDYSPRTRIISASKPGQTLEVRVVRDGDQGQRSARVEQPATKVTIARLPIARAPATPATGVYAPVAVDPAAFSAGATPPDMLVRHLQRELRRVGCYGGAIDGDWGPASR
ncbi:MAG: hypothetical protein KKB37_02870, partial [Alphaproteobacteria bacterium]|nr:hypothetical protein [Alphaproteobacteria bacterium]